MKSCGDSWRPSPGMDSYWLEVNKMIVRSRLGQLCRATSHEEILNLCDGYSLQDNQFFFDRSGIDSRARRHCYSVQASGNI